MSATPKGPGRLWETGGPAELTMAALAANQLLARGASTTLAGVYGLSLVERKTISAQTTATTFSSLTGDTDRHYLLLYRANVDDSISLYFQFNGAAGTDHDWEYIVNTGAAVSRSGGTADANGILFAAARPFGEASNLEGVVFINAATGKNRSVVGVYGGQGATVANRNMGITSGHWDNTATEVTSLEITADGADGLNTGVFSLYRIIDGT